MTAAVHQISCTEPV